MEAVLFIGIPGSGKSTFYRERFFHTHVRINLDMLKTLHRERALLETCLRTGQPFVIDKMNAMAVQRARYIVPSKAAGFRVVGYYFSSNPQECLERNLGRPEAQRVPPAAVFGAAKRLEIPKTTEGFDELYYVRLNPNGGFDVQAWREERDLTPAPLT